MQLAFEVTSAFYGEEQAAAAQDSFVKLFQKRAVPDEMPEYNLQPGQTVLDVLSAAGLIKSNGEGRRLIAQNGVRLDGEPLKEATAEFPHPGIGDHFALRRYSYVSSAADNCRGCRSDGWRLLVR